MKINDHLLNEHRIAEVVSDKIVINSTDDGADLLGQLYYSDYDRIILYEKNINPDFFDLKTGFAGAVLQKFSNFRVRLILLGNFEKFESAALNQFMLESNKGNQVNFLSSLPEALQRLSS